MDVILAQLETHELESHCRDAMNTQLKAMQRALKDALKAIKCAEEVQLASQKLTITLFKDDSELSATLLASAKLQDELATSLDRVMACSLGAGNKLAFETQKTNPTPQKKRKDSISTTQGAITKRQKCSLSGTIGGAVETSEKGSEVKSANALTKALSACTNLMKGLKKKKKVADRVPELKALVQHFNTAKKNLDRNSTVDQGEVLDTLSAVAEMAVSIMQHGKPEMTRHWVRKFRDHIFDIQEEFPDSATAFTGSICSLDNIISRFPLTIKEGQKLRVRLRGTLEEVKMWKDGQYSVADINQNMSLVAEALKSTCSNWSPLTDKTVRDLTSHLHTRLGVFKRSKKRAKRMQKLQMWLDKMDLDSQEGRPNGKMPPVFNAKIASKNQSHAQSVKLAPGLQNSVIELISSSTESSDTESTQHGSSVKLERMADSTELRC